VSGRRFSPLLVDEILVPLGLLHTAPNPGDPDAFAASPLDREAFMANMARGYALRDGQILPVEYPGYFGAAAGLVGSVRDLARYAIAIDEGRLLRAETWDALFAPATFNGRTLPAAIGWFVFRHRGITMHWAYGWWTGSSSLILRVPERGLTFVVAANSDAMSRRYRLGGDANVLRSDVARLFVESFVTGREPLPL
jgi:CubicO group peptidase (beta-lactamase class C family)